MRSGTEMRLSMEAGDQGIDLQLPGVLLKIDVDSDGETTIMSYATAGTAVTGDLGSCVTITPGAY